MEEGKVRLAIEQHSPPRAVDYCLNLWLRYRFDFRLANSRATKVGDFTYKPGAIPRITVNRDLHPFLFLITYLHELAHLVVHQQFGNRVDGHGAEWKKTFRQIIEPVLLESIFPNDVLQALRQHMADPRATTFSDPLLMGVLRRYDPKAELLTFLADIPEGSIFGIRGRWFKKGKTNRTRVVCQEVKSKRKYLVPIDAPVENVQLRLNGL